MRKDDKNRSRYKRIELYLKPHELELFRSKASGYHSLADMIRDAVTQHNDLGSLRKMEAMNELYSFYQRFQQELGWLGGNFNQVVKRANELALSGDLSQDYLDSVIIPQSQKVIPLLESIKAEHQRIAKKIIKIWYYWNSIICNSHNIIICYLHNMIRWSLHNMIRCNSHNMIIYK